MFLEPVSENEVIKKIEKLNNRKAIGHSDIPVKLMKSCKNELGRYLTQLFNMSMNQGVFPSVLKPAQVIPIYKGINKLHVENYRPISILSCISKMFERIIYRRLYKFLEKFDVLYHKQFGFRQKHSTIHALIEVTENIKLALDKDEIAIGIYLDLKKAFDTVDHDILLEKMCHWYNRSCTQLV